MLMNSGGAGNDFLLEICCVQPDTSRFLAISHECLAGNYLQPILLVLKFARFFEDEDEEEHDDEK